MNRPSTPLPWNLGVKQAEQIIYANGWAVANATVYHGRESIDETKANARYIVAACNAYPRLVTALREQLDAYMGDFAPDHIATRHRALLRELGEI